jgi:hypothetical protein
MILFDQGLQLEQEEIWTFEWHSVLIKDRERAVQDWNNFKVKIRFKSPFDINSVVFHIDDFNYGRRITTIFFLIIATQLFFS